MPGLVGVLCLPQGHKGSSQGFNPTSPRFQALLGEQMTAQGVQTNLWHHYLWGLGAIQGSHT